MFNKIPFNTHYLLKLFQEPWVHFQYEFGRKTCVWKASSSLLSYLLRLFIRGIINYFEEYAFHSSK